MKRYSFGLEGVLRARRAQEGIARSAVMSANSAARAAESAALKSLAHYEEILASPETDFLAKRERATLAARAMLAASESSRQAKAASEAAVSKYVEAKQAVTVLERLDERRRAEHAVAYQREEALAADEIATNRNRRKRAAGPR